MKISNKQILIILISVVVIFSVYAYFVRALTVQHITGFITIKDDKTSTFDANWFETKSVKAVLHVPIGYTDGTVTVCGYGFPSGVNAKADITKDGKIDYIDLHLIGIAYGCDSGQSACWNTPFSVEECYFIYSNGVFKDPNRDCKIDSSDVNIVASCYGTNPSQPASSACESSTCCKADVNNDGKVDLLDYALVARYSGSYADLYKNYVNLKYKDADINGDGKVNLQDYMGAALLYGQKADQPNCITYAPTKLSEGKILVDATMPGLYYVAVGYTADIA